MKNLFVIAFIAGFQLTQGQNIVPSERHTDVETEVPFEVIEKEILKLTTQIGSDSTNATLYERRALFYLSQKKFELAVIDYSNAIRISPDKSSSYFYRGLTKKSSEIEGLEMTACDDLKKAKELGFADTDWEIVGRMCGF